MKFSCQRNQLQTAIAIASRATAGKSPIPALEGILLEVNTGVSVTGYDLKKGIFTSFDADIQEEGAIVLGARLFGEIVRSLPADTVTVTVPKGSLMATITSGKAEFCVSGFHAEDFPELPAVDFQSNISIQQRVLKKMISESIFAVSDNESRPIYTGSLFEIENNLLTLVSVDGYRLALRRESVDESDVEACSFVVPGASLSELEKICSDTDEMVKITVGQKHISFSAGNSVLISRRLEGDFLNYKKTIPSEYTEEVITDRLSLLNVVERVSLIIDDKVKNPLRCSFENGEIRLSCVTALGKAEDTIGVSGDGGGMVIGFNNSYLREALKVAPSENVRICIISGTSPCIILPEDEKDHFLYMILPVRLKAGE